MLWSLRWGQAEAKLDELQAACRDGGSPLPRPLEGLMPRRHFQGCNPRRLALGAVVHGLCVAAAGALCSAPRTGYRSAVG